MHNLCTDPNDPWVRQRPHWIVKVSDGNTYYGDDDRPGAEENNSWLKLKRYVENNRLKLLDFKVYNPLVKETVWFRTGISNEQAGKHEIDAVDYLFVRGIIVYELGTPDQKVVRFVTAGYYDPTLDLVKAKRLEIPTLKVMYEFSCKSDLYKDVIINGKKT